MPNSRQAHTLISCWLSAVICDSMIRGNLAAKEQTSVPGTENCFLFTLPQILPEHNSDSCFHGILVAREPYKSAWSSPPLRASKNRTFATVREDWGGRPGTPADAPREIYLSPPTGYPGGPLKM